MAIDLVTHAPRMPIKTVPVATSSVQQELRTLTLARPHGPLVVDIWEPRSLASPVTPKEVKVHAATGVPTVLLIHGWGNAGGYWRSTAEQLAETARVIVPDLPGTGRSQPVQSAQTMFDQVATLVDLLDLLELTNVQVVGHSMGGAMALLLTDARPAQVERLVLTSTCFFLNEQQQQLYRLIMQITYFAMRFRPTWLAELPLAARLMATRYFYRVPNDDELLRQGFLDYLTLDLPTAVACADNACDPAIPTAGTRIQVPTLLIACRQDQVMPVNNVDYTLQMIPNSQVRWLDQCGHLPMVEKPLEYIAILREFLRLT